MAKPGISNLPPEFHPMRDTVNIVARGRKLFTADSNFVGLCPPWAQPGDGLFYICGSKWPVILRPCSTSATVTYTLVGVCQVSDVSTETARSALRGAHEINIC